MDGSDPAGNVIIRRKVRINVVVTCTYLVVRYRLLDLFSRLILRHG